MNAFKLNSITGHLVREAISEGLQIHYTEIYKEVKDISKNIIITKNNNKYKLKLEKIQ